MSARNYEANRCDHDLDIFNHVELDCVFSYPTYSGCKENHLKHIYLNAIERKRDASSEYEHNSHPSNIKKTADIQILQKELTNLCVKVDDKFLGHVTNSP